MTIRTVCGPPGAGKTTYVAHHAGPEDLVVDLDEIRSRYPDRETAASVRSLMERTARDYQRGDVWIIRTLADPQVRHEHAARVGADEVIVLATPAEEATRRAQERDGTTDLVEPITRWWETYSPHEGDTTITPDVGNDSPDKENTVGQQNSQDHQSGQGTTPPAQDDQQSGQSAPQGQQQGQQQSGQPGQQEPDRGYPANTPLEQMTVEQREAYWKHHSRKWEGIATSRSDYDQLAEDARQWREHQRRALPADERARQDAVEQARRDGEAQARLALAPQLVRAEFRAAAPGVEEDKLNSFLEDLDLSKYLKDDGTVDAARVQAKASLLPSTNPAPQRQSFQGYSRPAGTTSVAAGRDLFAARRGPKNS